MTCSELAQVLFLLTLRDNSIITVTAVTLLHINWQCPKKIAVQSYQNGAIRCDKTRINQKTLMSNWGLPFNSLDLQFLSLYKSSTTLKSVPLFAECNWCTVDSLLVIVYYAIRNYTLLISLIPYFVYSVTPSHENKLFYLVKWVLRTTDLWSWSQISSWVSEILSGDFTSRITSSLFKNSQVFIEVTTGYETWSTNKAAEHWIHSRKLLGTDKQRTYC